MHIKQIVIDNFKSFAHKTVVPFKQGFTTISGPNGSGKSNIIDSVLFCLGLSTSRTMRAEKLSDFVNNLSKRKEAIVTITFEKEPGETGMERVDKLAAADDDDGEQLGMLRADDLISDAEVDESDAARTPQSDSEEEPQEMPAEGLDTERYIQVTRRIKAGSGAYTSTYYLNGEVTTLTNIHEYLSRFHISPGMFNVMMQGDVAGIVNMSPVERRKIIDEIAGIAEFDRKIEQAQKELELTGQNVERNVILLTEIDVRLEQLSQEREHALKYQKLRDEKHRFEGMLLTAKYLDVKKAIAQPLVTIEESKTKKETSQENARQLVKEIAKTREKLLKLSEDVKKKGEDQYIALTKQIEGLKGHIARKEDTIQFNDEKIAENTERAAKLEEDIARQNENIETLDAEVLSFNEQLKELQTLFKKEAAALEKLEEQFDNLTGSGSELSVQRSEVRGKLSAAEDELSGLHRDKLDLEAEVKRQSYNTEKFGTLRDRHKTLFDQASDAETKKSVLEDKLRDLQLGYSTAKVKLSDATSIFNGLNREFSQLEAKKRAYDDLNFTRAAETVMSSSLKGVYGTLAQLGTVDADYGVAMEIALGGRVQNLVVDTDQTAKAGIELLQKQKAGRATFLPLNKIKANRDLPSLPDDAGVIDFAINLIDCDIQFDDIFAWALGDTLIVKNMDTARRYLKQFRMVTLDGNLLEKSGAMTGGSTQGKVAGYFMGGQFDEELQKLEAELTKAEAERKKADEALTTVELDLEKTKEAYAQILPNHSRLSAELDAVTAQLEELRQPGVDAEEVSDVSKIETQIAAIDKQITSAEQRVAALRKELDGVEAQLPSDQIEGLRKEMQEVKFQADHYDAQIRNVQADIKSKELEKNYQTSGIADCHTRIKETKESSKALQKEIKAANEEIELTHAQIVELEIQTEALDAELKKLQEKRDEVQNELIEQEKQKNIEERKIEEIDEQIGLLQTRQRELDEQLEALHQELEAAEVDPEAIQEEDLPSEEEVQKSIQKLARKMELMEPVNMLAIDEYDRVSERRNELNEKIETLNAEKEAISVRIAGYHELKRTAFMKSYENVDTNFQGIFAELSDGNGKLALANPENPFEGGLYIHAQPRGKKMQRIEALSGGEKSLTSLAFVFALQRYMPAPFYALDEVDQNLDGINAEKLASMVKRESKHAQFVVVSLRKPMIEKSDRTIGVTQKKDGITKVTGVKMRDDEDETTEEVNKEQSIA